MKNWLLAIFLFPTIVTAQIVNIEDQRINGTSDSVRWYGQLRLGANPIFAFFMECASLASILCSSINLCLVEWLDHPALARNKSHPQLP